jgi:serine/threonine protein kinase
LENEIGKYGYVEPQCFKNPGYKRDKQSDVYSLGVLLWEISSGRPPFYDTEKMVIALQVRDGKREPPVEKTPLEYQRLYQKCWDELPASRPDIDKVYETLTKLKSLF